MNLLHFRYRNRLGLLAAAALESGEASSVSKHVAGCEPCRRELGELTRTAVALAADAALDRPLPISSAALRTRVLARIREDSARPASRWAWSLRPVASAMAVLITGVVISRFLTSPAPLQVTPPGRFEASTETAATETAVNDAAFYERLEKTHMRANAARYLAEAQDVLIQVSAAADCPDSPKDNVDVGREAQTSRTLLKRRAALVSGSGESLMAARGVMEEVEGVLQEVAELPQCTRRIDVNAIARRVDRKHLLMKIDLVSQELAAP